MQRRGRRREVGSGEGRGGTLEGDKVKPGGLQLIGGSVSHCPWGRRGC